MLCLPGVASPTEAFAALAAGAGRTNVTHRTQANIQADKQAHMHMHGAGCVCSPFAATRACGQAGRRQVGG